MGLSGQGTGWAAAVMRWRVTVAPALTASDGPIWKVAWRNSGSGPRTISLGKPDCPGLIVSSCTAVR